MSWTAALVEFMEAIAAFADSIMEGVRSILPTIETYVDDYKSFACEQQEAIRWTREQWQYDQRMHQQRAQSVMIQTQAVRARQKPPMRQRARDKL